MEVLWLNKKCFFALVSVLMVMCVAGVAFGNSLSTIDKVRKAGKIIIGTGPGYYPFEMMDTEGNFIGYDMDLGRAIGKSLGVKVEFRHFEFYSMIPALQTGEIDMIISGMTIRGDRALGASFSNPYYATGQVIMVPSNNTTTKSWKELDKHGKKIAVSQGTTGALLAKNIFKEAEILDFPSFPEAASAMIGGYADGVVYDEPAVRMYEIMHKGAVRGIYNLISKENLGIAVRLNDYATIHWLNSFLYEYVDSPEEQASRAKWFESTDWMTKVKHE